MEPELCVAYAPLKGRMEAMSETLWGTGDDHCLHLFEETYSVPEGKLAACRMDVRFVCYPPASEAVGTPKCPNCLGIDLAKKQADRKEESSVYSDTANGETPHIDKEVPSAARGLRDTEQSLEDWLKHKIKLLEENVETAAVAHNSLVTKVDQIATWKGDVNLKVIPRLEQHLREVEGQRNNLNEEYSRLEEKVHTADAAHNSLFIKLDQLTQTVKAHKTGQDINNNSILDIYERLERLDEFEEHLDNARTEAQEAKNLISQLTARIERLEADKIIDQRDKSADPPRIEEPLPAGWSVPACDPEAVDLYDEANLKPLEDFPGDLRDKDEFDIALQNLAQDAVHWSKGWMKTGTFKKAAKRFSDRWGRKLEAVAN